MKKSYFLILTNLILILIISNRYPKSELFVFLKLSLPIIIFLIVGAYTIIKLKRESFGKIFFVQNLISTIVLAILTYAVIQGQIDKTEMHYDATIAHENQKEVENAIKSFISENALYPNSYEPIEFGNVNSMKVRLLNAAEDSATK